MNQYCPEYLSEISDVLSKGMAFAISVWSPVTPENLDALDWLQHGACDTSAQCGAPYLKVKNFKFTAKDGVSNPLDDYLYDAPPNMESS